MVDVVIAAGAGGARLERHVRVEVDGGRDTAIPVGSPTDSTSRTLVMTVLSVALWLILR